MQLQNVAHQCRSVRAYEGYRSDGQEHLEIVQPYIKGEDVNCISYFTGREKRTGVSARVNQAMEQMAHGHGQASQGAALVVPGAKMIC